MLQAPHSHLVVPLRPPPQHRRTPSPPTTRHVVLPVPLPRLPTPPLSPVPVSSTRSDRSRATIDAADVLCKGDLLGTGRYLNGELVREVSRSPLVDHQPATAFEVVRKLGTGSYAVVYQVRERLDALPESDVDSESDEQNHVLGTLELDMGTKALSSSSCSSTSTHSISNKEPQYGREYAIKCLSKANLGEDALQAQLLEATIHQSLPVHPGIVTLYRTLETDSLLLLLLELVPGEDLFYFLEQARDHQSDNEPHHAHSVQDLSITPPTPSLLSSFHPQQLLSYGRLRLIASMFAQMCDAVATCHAHGIAHRDIKPENFIVTDAWTTAPDGTPERRVVVKLTDFGLATFECESADMECGSAPYMSYECRNNLAPTYFPRPADVWSLGVVLINMLYHRNPWADTSIGACSAFELFRENPVDFFLHSFLGMTRDVAEYLAESVFCILDSPDDTRRVSAHDFGHWSKHLPTLFNVRRPSPPAIVTQLAEEGQQKRQRKRGARKGKGAQNAAASVASLPSPEDDRLDSLASANQDLVRELSRMSTRSSVNSFQSSLQNAPPVPPLPSPLPPFPSPQRKQSRWKGVFSLQKQSTPEVPAVLDLKEEFDSPPAPRQMSATVSNVSNIIMGLSAPPQDDRGRRRDRSGERPRDNNRHLNPQLSDWQSGASSASSSRVRNPSPLSTKSRHGQPNLARSLKSDNWRNSMSSNASVGTGSSSTNFTRFSNASMRSVSTANTSISASSWRTGHGGSSVSGNKPAPPRMPSNVKEMSGIPYELSVLPRDHSADMFNVPPSSKKPARGNLAPIAEGPRAQQRHSPPSRSKLSVSTTNAEANELGGMSPPHSPSTPPSDGQKKVNKGQINTLAKMLSALKAR